MWNEARMELARVGRVDTSGAGLMAARMPEPAAQACRSKVPNNRLTRFTLEVTGHYVSKYRSCRAALLNLPRHRPPADPPRMHLLSPQRFRKPKAHVMKELRRSLEAHPSNRANALALTGKHLQLLGGDGATSTPEPRSVSSTPHAVREGAGFACVSVRFDG